MTILELPFRAGTAEACSWLAQQTGAQWTLTDLLAHGLTPYVWLDYDAACPALFGEANGGYAAPIFFEGDIARLAGGSEDVLITITKDADKIVTKLVPPGLHRGLHELRFLKKDLERLASKLEREARAAAEPAPYTVVTESTLGITRQQVMLAFASFVKIDLEQALADAGGIFGDDGARVKGSGRKAKNKAIWNPVTLALGMNDVYRVPISHLKRMFKSHDFLETWTAEWEQSLLLLGK
jgi:hypothetical protein